MKPDRDEVLWRFTEEYRKDPTALRRWSRRYPEYAEDFVAEVALGCRIELPSDQGLPMYELASGGSETRPMAEVMLAAMRTARDHGSGPLTSIVERARSLGIEPSRLSATLNLGKSVVAKLERRLVDPATVPAALFRKLGKVLGVSSEAVRSYLDRPPTLAMAASYKAQVAPQMLLRDSQPHYREPRCVEFEMSRRLMDAKSVGDYEEDAVYRETFEAAVLGAPDMEEAQKQAWLSPEWER